MSTTPKGKILLVEDEPDILFVCKKGLLKRFKVDAFSASEEALKHFRQHYGEYELVLTDIRMPKLSGFELAREIRIIRPDITILFMTAFETTPGEYKDTFPSADSSHFISKPISISRLEQIVTQHLKV